MPIKVNLPDGRIVNFPDGMDPAAIEQALSEIGGPVASHESAPERSWTDTALDLLPTAGGVAGGIIGAGAGPLGAVGGAGLGGMFGETVKKAFRPEDETLGEAFKDVGTQGLVQAGSEVGGRAVGGLLTKGARRLYQSALKPSTSLPASTRRQMVETGIKERVPVTEGGAGKILGPIDAATKKRTGGGLLTKSKDKADVLVADRETLLRRTGVPAAYSIDPKQAAAGGVAKAANEIKDLSIKQPHLQAIGDRSRQYLAENPTPIPITKAQASVRAGDKFYDKAYRATIDKGDPIKSGPALADIGINDETRELLRTMVPGLKEQNAVTSRLAGLGDAVEQRAATQRNLSVAGMQRFGINAGVGGLAGYGSGDSDKGWQTFAILEALTNPAIASRLAIGMGKAGSSGMSAQAIRQALISLMASHDQE